MKFTIEHHHYLHGGVDETKITDALAEMRKEQQEFFLTIKNHVTMANETMQRLEQKVDQQGQVIAKIGEEVQRVSNEKTAKIAELEANNQALRDELAANGALTASIEAKLDANSEGLKAIDEMNPDLEVPAPDPAPEPTPEPSTDQPADQNEGE